MQYCQRDGSWVPETLRLTRYCENIEGSDSKHKAGDERQEIGMIIKSDWKNEHIR